MKGVLEGSDSDIRLGSGPVVRIPRVEQEIGRRPPRRADPDPPYGVFVVHAFGRRSK